MENPHGTLAAGYALSGGAVTDGPSNPLMKTVVREGNWLIDGPLGRWAMLAAAIAIVAALAAPLLIGRRRHLTAFIASSVAENAGAKPQTIQWFLRVGVSKVDDKLLISQLEWIR